MRLKLLPLLIILSSCGKMAPVVDNCWVATADLSCYRQNVIKNQSHDYRVSPSEAQAKAYICQSPADFLLSKTYVITLEKNLAACVKTPIPKPKVTDCAIDGSRMMVYCSDGQTSTSLSWDQAYKYLCLSGADYLLMQNYRRVLLEEIQNCK